MDTNQIYEILRSGSPDARQNLLCQFPESSMTESVSGFFTSGRPERAVIACFSLATAYCHGQSPEDGFKLAFASHRLAQELYESGPKHAGLVPTTLSGLAL